MGNISEITMLEVHSKLTLIMSIKLYSSATTRSHNNYITIETLRSPLKTVRLKRLQFYS